MYINKDIVLLITRQSIEKEAFKLSVFHRYLPTVDYVDISPESLDIRGLNDIREEAERLTEEALEKATADN